MDISVTVCLRVLSVFVWLRISPPRIKLAASNFARRFTGVPGRESPIFVNCAPRSPKSDESANARAMLTGIVNITVEMRRGKRHARDAPFVEYRAGCGRRIGTCGHTRHSESPLTYLSIIQPHLSPTEKGTFLPVTVNSCL